MRAFAPESVANCRALLSAVNGALSPLITTPLPAETSWLLALAGLLVLVLTGIYLGVVNWARELIGRLGRWALQMPQGPAEDAARTEKLRRTLAGWLKFGQWGTLVSALLSAAVTLGLTLYADQWTGSLSDVENAALGPGFTSILGPGYVAFQTLSSLVSSIPGVVVTWLILGAILRFVNLTVLRVRGMASGPVTPAATVVSNWFLACLILIGLVGLQLVLSLVIVLVSLPLLRDPAVLGLSLPWSGLLNVLPGLLTGLLVYSLLLYGLYFALLLLSRTFALALARTLDLGNAPAPAPVNAGEAGATPNVYRGQSL